MNGLRRGWALLALLLLTQVALTADAPTRKSARDALKPFNELIGAWRALGTLEGTRAEKEKGLWREEIRWEWQFKGSDAWLTVAFDKGKYFAEGTLRYLADKDHFQLTLQTIDKQTVTFTGPLKDHLLALERQDDKTKETQRLVISLLHDNRYLYHYEVKPEGRTQFAKKYLVGATKEGVPFALSSGQFGPFCVVSGGPPTSPMTYKGKTYYVCCGGCREAFKAEPEKFIKEYEELMAKMAKDRADKTKKP
jgi:hypothetical protein